MLNDGLWGNTALLLKSRQQQNSFEEMIIWAVSSVVWFAAGGDSTGSVVQPR